MKTTNRKHYSEAFKKKVVMCVMRENSSANRVSKDLGISQSVLSRWVKNITFYPSNILNREFNPKAFNQKWGSDTTFIRSKKGWLHLCSEFASSGF